MHISIVTAAFDTTYLDGVWISIKKQTFTQWEWILAIDNSPEVEKWMNNKIEAGEFINRDVWWVSIQKNRDRYGLVARNVGAMVATYDRIIFLDDDNEFEEEDYLEAIVMAEKETGKIPYTKLHLLGKKPGSTYDRYKNTALARHNIDLGNVLYRKKHFLKYGYFDDSRNRIMFDFDLIEAIRNGEGAENFIQVDKNLFFRHKRY